MPLRIGKLSDEARPLNNGFARESRRLMKKGFRDEAGKLAMMDTMDRLKNGNIGSAEQDAETANYEANLTRVSQAQRLREAAGLSRKSASETPTSTSTSSDDTTKYSSPATGSPTASSGNPTAPVAPYRPTGTPAKSTIGTVEGLKGAIKATAEKDRRKALRDAYDKVVDPTGKEKASVSEKVPDSLKPSGGGLEPLIADLEARRQSSLDLLKKYAKPIEMTGPPAPVEMSGPPTRLFVAGMQKERGQREAAAAESATSVAPASPATPAPAKSDAFNAGARINNAIRNSMKGPDYSLPENAPSFTPAEIKKPELKDVELTPEAKRAAERLKKKVATPALDFGKGLLSGS